MGNDGVERFVVTPELQSQDGIGIDPLDPGQIWAINSSIQDAMASGITDHVWTAEEILEKMDPAFLLR